MLAGLGLYQIPARFKVGKHRLTGGVTVKALIFPAVGVYGGVAVHYVYLLQAVTFAHQKVVGVVRGGDLDAAGAELFVHVIVGYYGDLASDKRQDQRLAHQRGVAFVVGVDRNGGIAQQSFGACGGDLYKAAAVFERIAYVPEMAVFFFVFHFGVRKRGLALRAPVDYAVAAVGSGPYCKAKRKFLLPLWSSPRPW